MSEVVKTVQRYKVRWLNNDTKTTKVYMSALNNLQAKAIANVLSMMYPKLEVFIEPTSVVTYRGDRNDFEDFFECTLEELETVQGTPESKIIASLDKKRVKVWEASKLCQPTQLKPNYYYGMAQDDEREHRYFKVVGTTERMAVSQVFGASPVSHAIKEASKGRPNPISRNQLCYREWYKIFRQMGKSRGESRKLSKAKMGWKTK